MNSCELVYLLADSVLFLSSDYRWIGRFLNDREITKERDRVEFLNTARRDPFFCVELNVNVN